ncbi:MAG: hypothetical protein GXC76_02390 [Rhodanobacteraceae bacterium]|jgi:hypothetical protein|nr:hypothetical protein [Rhodanobacteraceae bacterium]
MNPSLSRYLADVGWPTATYFASVLLAAWLTRHVEPGALRMAVAALPLPAIAWMARAELMRLRRRDELRQRIEMEAMTIAFALSFGLVAMLTFFDLFGVFSVGLRAVAVLMAACWTGAHLWVRTRYHYDCLPGDAEDGR